MEFRGPVLTKGDFIELAKGHRADAYLLLEKGTTNGTWFHIGLAVECCLKAAIMQKEGWNSWPDREQAKGLYTHNLLELFRKLGIDPAGFDARAAVAPALKTVLEWRREHGYARGKVPRKVARSLCEAAFGDRGVVEWLAKNYRLDI
ncbi:MAG: hypothetical protein JOZ72_19650 [Alphaproteobacteria bacterium]|nr:hypothetical protein [Alphaproteobacteria bacterium]